MKHIIVILITSVFSVIACNDSNSKVRSYKIDNSQTLSVIREIEYIIDSLDQNNIMLPSQSLNKATIESAEIVWKKFTEQCIKQNYNVAYRIFNKHKGDFKVYLKHSSTRYIFLCDIYYPFLLAFECPNDVDMKFLEEIEIEYQLQVASIKNMSKDKPYVPEYHPNTIMDYGRCLNRLGRTDDAVNLATELKDAVLFLSNDKMEANYAVAWYGAHIFKDVGQIDAALNLLFKFKHDIHTWKTEDREDELTEDYYNHYIGLVNMLIDEIKDSSAL